MANFIGLTAENTDCVSRDIGFTGIFKEKYLIVLVNCCKLLFIIVIQKREIKKKIKMCSYLFTVATKDFSALKKMQNEIDCPVKFYQNSLIILKKNRTQ